MDDYFKKTNVLGGVGTIIQEYETFVEATCIHKDNTYPFLGLAGETGEVLEQLKKAWREEGVDWIKCTERKDKIYDELSDVLWYLTRCLHVLNDDLESLMEYNMDKLTQRMEGKSGD